MTLLASLQSAAALADAGDRLELLRVTTAREADRLRARWAANAAAYWCRRDEMVEQAKGAR